MEIVQHQILGANLAKLDTEKLLQLIKFSVDYDKRYIISYQNFHGLYLLNRDKRLNSFFKDSIIIIDGMPLVLMGNILGYKLKKTNRLAWIDFIKPLIKLASDNNWSIFYLGTTEETA